MTLNFKRDKLKSVVFFIFFVATTHSFAQNNSPTSINFKQLQHKIDRISEDTILVVNFWATWCKPCVEEMPVIENITSLQGEIPIKVLLVSLDFPEKIESKLVPFLKKKVILSEVVVLDEKNPNDWIPEIDDKWSGGIPASLFIYKNKKVFHEGQVSLDFIQDTLNSLSL